MRVTLVKSPAAYQRDGFSSGNCIPPIGLAYLASYLESLGHPVSVVDGLGEGISTFHKVTELNLVIRGLSAKDLVSRIPADTEAIGISCMFSTEWMLDDYVIGAIREKFPNVPIIVGGEHVTADWKNLLASSPEVDYCVLGEGEETLGELLACLSNGQSVSAVPGIAYRGRNGIEKTERRARRKHLDSQPWPAWEKFPVRNYHDTGSAFTTLNRRAMPILATRGCPYSCSFCSSPQMWGTELYHRDPEDVVREMKKYIETYDIEHIDFCDIVGVLNPKWAKELLTIMLRERLNVSWMHGAGTRSEILTDELLDLFKKTNVLRVFYAPETGSKKTVEKIKKRVDLPKMMRSMRAANRRGISMRAPLIYGFPGQTLGEVLESVIFGLKLILIGVDDVVVHIFTAYPGSEFYQKLVQSGKIDVPGMIASGQYHDFLRNQIITRLFGQRSWSEHIPGFALPLLQLGTMSFYYAVQFTLRPWRLFRSLKRVLIRRKPLTLFDHVLYRLAFGAKYRIKFDELPEYDLPLRRDGRRRREGHPELSFISSAAES